MHFYGTSLQKEIDISLFKNKHTAVNNRKIILTSLLKMMNFCCTLDIHI